MEIGIITLESMRFYAYHGCYETERKIGSPYTVDLSLRLDLSRAGASDQLEDTINYGTAFAIVAKVMASPSNLLEHVAHVILDDLFSTFPSLEGASVKISKIAPAMGQGVQLAAASVTLDRNRE